MQWHVRVAYGVEGRDVDGAFLVRTRGGDARGFYGERTFTENSGQSLIRYKWGGANVKKIQGIVMCAFGCNYVV